MGSSVPDQRNTPRIAWRRPRHRSHAIGLEFAEEVLVTVLRATLVLILMVAPMAAASFGLAPAGLSTALAASAGPVASRSAQRPGTAPAILRGIKFLGTADVAFLGKHAHQAAGSTDTRRAGGYKLTPDLSPKGGAAAPASPADRSGSQTRGLPLTPAGVQAYDGVNAADSRLARDGNQYTNAPPDGGICSGGGGEKVETVNSAFGFFDAGGKISFPPIAQTSFFGLPPSIDRSTNPPTFPGPSVGDAKCVYDSGTGRMILLTWGTGQDPNDGSFNGHNDYFIAVAKTRNVLGNYNLYDIPLDPPGSKGCHPVCESDHPTLSTDANTIVTTYNKYGGPNLDFEGARIIALSKAAMEQGKMPNAVEFNAGSLGGGMLYTLQGANAPADGVYANGNGGTMWFLSALQFVQGQADDRVAVEALMNTSAIDSDPSTIAYNAAIVPGTNRYLSPPVTPQKKGPFPLGKSVGEPLNYLDSGNDEMQPTWYANGQIWGVLDSRVGVGETLRGGLLWMSVAPSGSQSAISGKVRHQQFVSVTTNWLDYGAIAINGAGTEAIITASMAGPGVYPSAVYGWIDTSVWAVRSLHVYLQGVRPIDDFDCYKVFNPDFKRGCRFGDYNGAVLNNSAASFTLEAEYVSPRARVVFGNWGTALAVAKF
jgi:hypothetical protein